MAALGVMGMMMFVMAWGITDTKNKLQQQIEQIPQSIQRHQIEQQEPEMTIQQGPQNPVKKKKKK
jgi:hypothetical protein